MARVVLLALGSRGDVLPHIALAVELRRSGHDAVVVSIDDFEPLAAAWSVPFLSFSPGRTLADWEVASSTEWRRRYEQSPLGAAGALRRIMTTVAEPVAAALDDVVGHGDVVVAGILGMPVALALAETRQCTVVHVTFAATLPTSDGWAYVSAPLPTRVSRVNRWVSGWMSAEVLRWAQPPAAVLRRRWNLPPTSAAQLNARLMATPTLVAASRLIAPPAGDWPCLAASTGPWLLPSSPVTPSAELAAFLAAGPPPVYIGMGSAFAGNPARDVELFAQAATMAGVRALIRPSEFGFTQPPAPLSPSVHLVKTIAHDWLFPQLAAVVHHGGAGTTTAALRAGVPSSVVWHAFDQPFNGRRCAELGVGPRGFGKRHLTAERLADVLRELTTSPRAVRYRKQARDAAHVIASEAGVSGAVRQLDKWGVLGPPPHSLPARAR